MIDVSIEPTTHRAPNHGLSIVVEHVLPLHIFQQQRVEFSEATLAIPELLVFSYSYARSPKLLPTAIRRRRVCMLTQVNLLEMSNAEVEAFLVAMGEPKFRAKQVRQ